MQLKDGVPVNDDEGLEREADEMGAKAFATGNHVAFDGQPTVHIAAHEAAHVVQQRGGVQLKGIVGEVGEKYARHADLMADNVVCGESAQPVLDRTVQKRGAGEEDSGMVQMAPADFVGCQAAGLEKGRNVFTRLFLKATPWSALKDTIARYGSLRPEQIGQREALLGDLEARIADWKVHHNIDEREADDLKEHETTKLDAIRQLEHLIAADREELLAEKKNRLKAYLKEKISTAGLEPGSCADALACIEAEDWNGLIQNSNQTFTVVPQADYEEVMNVIARQRRQVRRLAAVPPGMGNIDVGYQLDVKTGKQSFVDMGSGGMAFRSHGQAPNTNRNANLGFANITPRAKQGDFREQNGMAYFDSLPAGLRNNPMADPARHEMMMRPKVPDAEHNTTVSLTPGFVSSLIFPHIEEVEVDKVALSAANQIRHLVRIYVADYEGKHVRGVDPLAYSEDDNDQFLAGEFQVEVLPTDDMLGSYLVERVFKYNVDNGVANNLVGKRFGVSHLNNFVARVLRYERNGATPDDPLRIVGRNLNVKLG